MTGSHNLDRTAVDLEVGGYRARPHVESLINAGNLRFLHSVKTNDAQMQTMRIDTIPVRGILAALGLLELGRVQLGVAVAEVI